MMNSSIFKIILKTALVCATAIIIYDIANQLFIYRYFKFDYYLAVVALVSLITGIFITRKANERSSQAIPFTDLTNKELHILHLISEGKSNKEIAAQNFVELSTVKTHINNLYSKLNVSNRKQAIEIYRQRFADNRSTLSPPSVI